jgi:CRISPR-associated protein Cas1
MSQQEPPSRQQHRQASADRATKVAAPVAHLLGPGVLRVRNQMPCWEPLEGRPLLLHPQRLRTLIVHGLADLTGAALRLLWRHGVQLTFVNRHGGRLLGRLSPPPDEAPSLACWQHWAVRDADFVLPQARRLVAMKLEGVAQVAEYFLHRGNTELGSLQQAVAADLRRLSKATSLASLRGLEGAASARWHAAMRKLFPPSLPYLGRRCHPPTDPVNALLSLGYMLLLTRIQAELSAIGLDPLVGVYHQPRPGKPALACDLIEPFRAPVVDRLVLAQVRRGCFLAKHFTDTPKGIRLRQEDSRRFVKAFEDWFTASSTAPSFQTQARQLVCRFAGAVRRWAQNDRSANHGRPPADAAEDRS